MARTVLVVNEQLDVLRRYATTLDRAGFRVRICRSAGEAGRLAAQDPPGLIVAGLAQPGADGWRALERLAADPATATIPILAATGIGPQSPSQGVQVQGFLLMPLQRGELARLVAELVPG
jgi:CheY-like chemotaxis protein